MLTPLELLNLYYSDGQSTGNRENKLWRKMNTLLSWDNILNKGYQADLCPLLYYILAKWLPAHSAKCSAVSNPTNLHPVKCCSYSTGATNPTTLRRNDTMTEVNDILLRLKEEYRWSLARNMLLFDELGLVLKAFSEANIEVIVLKGAALAQTVYPDIALRPMGDVDLLVKKKSLEKAEKLLTDLGYDKFIRKDSKNHSFHNAYIRMWNDQAFVIEVHWDLVREIFYTKIDLDELWYEAIPINSFEEKALTLSPMPYLLYLCWHGSRHGFERLIWICDIATIIKNNSSSINWNLLQQKSLSWKISKPFLFSLNMARNLLNEFPPSKGILQDGFGTTDKQIFDYLVLKIQNRKLKRKNSQNVSNLLSWFLIRNLGDKIKHLFSRTLETRMGT